MMDGNYVQGHNMKYRGITLSTSPTEKCVSSNDKEYEIIADKFRDITLSHTASRSSSNGGSMEFLISKFKCMELSSAENSSTSSFTGEINHENSVFDTNDVFNNKTTLMPIITLMDQKSVNKIQEINDENCKNALVDEVEKVNFPRCKDTNSDNELLDTLDIPSSDTLISFESPNKLSKPLVPKNLFPDSNKSFKMYSEDEFRDILKIQERRSLEEFSKTFSSCELQLTKKNLKLEQKLSKILKMSKLYSGITSDVVQNLVKIYQENETSKAKLKNLAGEKGKLEADIKASKEDLSYLETTFSDLHKRYEQCKSLVKICEKNEDHLQKNVESTQNALNERSNMYDILRSRAEEVLEKATEKVENTKKSFQIRITALENDLQKAQMKQCGLEKDLKEIQLKNDELDKIYNGLLTKIRL